jgi:hypothetical protein
MQDLIDYLSTLESRLAALEAENRSMKNVINDVSSDAEKNVGHLNPSLPQTNLLSTKFLIRAFAVLGHYFMAQLAISIVVGIYISVFFFTSIIAFLNSIKIPHP